MSDSATIRVKGLLGVSLSIDILLSGTVGDLKKIIADRFKLYDGFDILWGYPPTLCNLPDDATVRGSIAANDCIRVQRLEHRDHQAEGLAATKSNTRKVKASTPSKTIQKSSGVSSSGIKVAAFGSRIMSLTGAVTTSSPSLRQQKRRVSPFQPNIITSTKRKRVGSKNGATSGDGKEDICSALMSAADGGAGGRSKALRSVFRNAVLYQYNDSLAVGRLRAAFAGRYTFEECIDARVLGTGASTKMNVTFPLKPESARSALHTENVDLLSIEMLRAVLLSALEDDDGAGAAREFLKPVNMTKASPRIFWSLIKAFGPDISSGLSQLFPQVVDWSWLVDRKRGLSEIALINQAQKKEATELAAARKRIRDLKKNKVLSGGTGPPVVENNIVSDCDQDGSMSSPVPATTRGMNDPAIVAALNTKNLVVDSLVPECWVSVLKDLKVDSVLLLADLDFEEPECLSRFNNASASSSTSSSSSSHESVAKVISIAALEAWVSTAQSALFGEIMKALLGGCRRLQSALYFLGQRSPLNLRVWKSMPEILYQKILDRDPGLGGVSLSRIGVGVQIRELFSVEWVLWMCTVCEDMRETQSVLWLPNYSVDEDEDDEEEDQGEVVVDDDSGWTYIADTANHIGSKVRCFPLSEDYWDEGQVVGYLAPDEEEPMALWRIKGVRKGTAFIPSNSDSTSSSTITESNMWTLDLEENEVNDALALYIVANLPDL